MIGLSYVGCGEIIEPVTDLSKIKSGRVEQIDDTVATILARSLRFEPIYLAREAAARAFKDAGYAGDAGEWITSFSIPAKLSTMTAANIIITQADNLRAVLLELETLRMRKYELLQASDADAANSIGDEIMALIKIAEAKTK